MPEASTRYSRAAIVIHWLTAAGVILAVALGWRLADAGGTERAAVLAWHMSAGIAILVVTLARIGVRAVGHKPGPVGSLFEQRAARVVHAAFYVALILIPLLGWLSVSASGSANRVFGLLPLPALPGAAGMTGFAEGAHRVLAYGLCFVIGLHVAAAIRHHFFNPATGLPRILPGAQRLWGWRAVSVALVLVVLFSFGSGAADGWLPNALRLSGEPPASRYASIDPRRAHVFATVLPIFDEKCASCHGANSQKGGLRLDNFAAVTRGGEGGKVIVAGKVDESELIKRILLPPTHKNAMPPAGKAALTPAESQLLMWWISAGGDDSTTIAAANPPALVQNILQNLGVSSDSPVFKRPVALPEANALASLRDTFEVQFLFRGQGFLQAQPRFDHDTKQALPIDALASVAEQLVRLDLSGGSISASQFQALARLKNLQRLNLARTATDDAGVGLLLDLPYLEVLNLYGTKVTDASLEAMRRMPALMTVYLSGTAVTAEAVGKLREAQPGLSVVWDPAETG